MQMNSKGVTTFWMCRQWSSCGLPLVIAATCQCNFRIILEKHVYLPNSCEELPIMLKTDLPIRALLKHLLYYSEILDMYISIMTNL